MASVGIIGAGIAGLTAAYRLADAGHRPVLFEKDARPGGRIYSERFDGPGGSYHVEFGPNSLRRATPLLNELLGAVGLAEERVEASEAAQRRYVVFSGRPVALPSSLTEFLGTELFSPQAKARLLAEPFARGSANDADESVADFARRRLGEEILDYGLNPFTAGVFAGDPEALSLRHAFPRIHALEAEYGSLLGGGLKKAGRRLLQRLTGRGEERAEEDTPDDSGGPFTLRGGLDTLPRALAARFGDALHYETKVRALRRTGEGRWRVSCAPPGEREPSLEEPTFDAVVWAAPLPALASLTPALDADTGPLLDVSYPPVSLVAMGFPRSDIAHPLDGFGMLVPEAERSCRTLGTLFSSTVFPRCAPDGHVLLTTFVGGARDPALAEASDAVVYDAVYHDLRRVLGAHKPPAFRQRFTWARAIPQYHVGYGRVKHTLDYIEEELPGLHFAGNYRAGVSVGDAAASGDAAARKAAERLSS